MKQLLLLVDVAPISEVAIDALLPMRNEVAAEIVTDPRADLVRGETVLERAQAAVKKDQNQLPMVDRDALSARVPLLVHREAKEVVVQVVQVVQLEHAVPVLDPVPREDQQEKEVLRDVVKVGQREVLRDQDAREEAPTKAAPIEVAKDTRLVHRRSSREVAAEVREPVGHVLRVRDRAVAKVLHAPLDVPMANDQQARSLARDQVAVLNAPHARGYRSKEDEVSASYELGGTP